MVINFNSNLGLCDDFNYYVCKYNRQTGVKAVKLFHEYLAGSFAKIWKLAIPDFSLVNVNPDHIIGHKMLQPSFFRTLCFGSKYNSRFTEMDEFYTAMTTSNIKKFELKFEFLKIGLFDIWLANEDRNFNNYNLLIDIGNRKRFVPIDHDAIFNTGNLDKGLALLAENETLINTGLTRLLFSANELQNNDFLVKSRNDYYICIEECERNLKAILENIPKEWKINVVDYQNLLKIHLFGRTWTARCFDYFQELIHMQLLKQ